MPYFTMKQRLTIALGGFLTSVGLTLLILKILDITGKINIDQVLEANLVIISIIIAIVAIFDVLAGIILLRRS
ncbi:MAG: hypothetical protein PVF96_07865 [Candidatus Bathyarchaeota archaeon]|jgi:hypothetical protein